MNYIGMGPTTTLNMEMGNGKWYIELLNRNEKLREVENQNQQLIYYTI